MDTATRREFFHALRTEVRREIVRMRRFERLLTVASVRGHYPSSPDLARLQAETRKARRQHDDLIEEVLLMLSVPPPSLWARLRAWLRRCARA